MVDFLDKLNIVLQPSNITLATVLFSLVMAFILGVVISYVYRKTNRGFSYETSFSFTLVMVTIIVTTIMITIGSNIALSLGLIGSLSIIRFRSVVKNTADMAYLFWAIASGLAIGAESYNVALGGVILIALVVLLLTKTKFLNDTNVDYILVINFLPTSEQNKTNQISGILNKNNLSWEIKSRHISNNKAEEVTYSIHSNKKEIMDKTIDEVKILDGLAEVSVLSPESNLYI